MRKLIIILLVVMTFKSCYIHASSTPAQILNRHEEINPWLWGLVNRIDKSWFDRFIDCLIGGDATSRAGEPERYIGNKYIFFERVERSVINNENCTAAGEMINIQEKKQNRHTILHWPNIIVFSCLAGSIIFMDKNFVNNIISTLCIPK